MRFLAILSIVLLVPSLAFATSLVVEITPINPKGVPQAVICTDYKPCMAAIALESNPKLKATLLGLIKFVPGNISIKFQTPEGYFYVGDKNGASSIVWRSALGTDESVDENVTLHLPQVPIAAADSLNRSLVLQTTDKHVADLEIKVSPISKWAEPNQILINAPPTDVIPDKATALQVAEAILKPIYGEAKIKSEEPLTAALEDGIWRIGGTMPKAADGGVMVGGVVEIDISKSDGKVLRITHGE